MRKTLDGIAYDKVLDNRYKEVEFIAETLAKRGYLPSKRNENNPFPPLTGSFVGYASDQHLCIQYNNSKKLLGKLQQSHVFLLGPATLDSLVEVEPQDYSYVSEGKFPFDNCYFSFLEPQQMPIAWKYSNTLEAREVIGLHMVATSTGYQLTFSALANGNQQTLMMNVSNPNSPRILFSTGYKSDANAHVSGFTTCIYSASQRVIWARDELFNEEATDFNLRLLHEDPGLGDPKVRTLSIDDDKFAFVKPYSNLVVNIINYINAHNVQVVSKERTVKVRDPNCVGDNKARNRSYPISIVQVRDGIINPTEESGFPHEIDYRYYVRGHNRHYRRDDGELKFVRWIRPQVRGPESAPFKTQFHEISAKKLLAEKKMAESFS